jgi:hypothetical protein
MSSQVRSYMIAAPNTLAVVTFVGALCCGACGESHGADDGAVSGELFHVPGSIDAVNLEINRSSRTFRWSIYGCDFSGGGSGRVEVDGAVLLLRPSAGAGDFGWPGGRTDGVRLSPGPEPGQLTEAATPEVIWEPGGICAICGGLLGPTGVEPCEEPFFDL